MVDLSTESGSQPRRCQIADLTHYLAEAPKLGWWDGSVSSMGWVLGVSEVKLKCSWTFEIRLWSPTRTRPEWVVFQKVVSTCSWCALPPSTCGSSQLIVIQMVILLTNPFCLYVYLLSPSYWHDTECNELNEHWPPISHFFSPTISTILYWYLIYFIPVLFPTIMRCCL